VESFGIQVETKEEGIAHHRKDMMASDTITISMAQTDLKNGVSPTRPFKRDGSDRPIMGIEGRDD